MTFWPTVQVRRVFGVANGGTPTGDASHWDGDVPWATPADLALVDGGYLTTTRRTLTEEGVCTGSGSVPEQSLILSTRAPIGYVVQTTERTAFNQGCRGLVPHRLVDIGYFRYQFHSAASRLRGAGQGSTFNELSGNDLASSLIVLPPLASIVRAAP